MAHVATAGDTRVVLRTVWISASMCLVFAIIATPTRSQSTEVVPSFRHIGSSTEPGSWWSVHCDRGAEALHCRFTHSRARTLTREESRDAARSMLRFARREARRLLVELTRACAEPDRRGWSRVHCACVTDEPDPIACLVEVEVWRAEARLWTTCRLDPADFDGALEAVGPSRWFGTVRDECGVTNDIVIETDADTWTLMQTRTALPARMRPGCGYERLGETTVFTSTAVWSGPSGCEGMTPTP